MGYLERILHNYGTLMQVLLCGAFCIGYYFISRFIAPELVHLILMSVGGFWVWRKIAKIRKRILRYVYGLVERERNHNRQHEEEYQDSPIGFQQQVNYPEEGGDEYQDKKRK